MVWPLRTLGVLAPSGYVFFEIRWWSGKYADICTFLAGFVNRQMSKGDPYRLKFWVKMSKQIKPMSWSRSDLVKNVIFVKIGCTGTNENILFLKIFENRSSGTLQNEGFSACSLNYFTMVETYFENQCSESTRVTDFQFS